tara:strand:- start:461 stop:1711 length:1251 start_codon:yes stop_codon:yes gene_type:complete
MKFLKLILTFAIFTNLFLVDVHSVTHEKFKKQLKNTKDKINKLNKNVPKSNPSKSKDVNIKNKTTSKTNPTCRKGKNFIFFGKTDNYIRVVGPDKFRNEYNEVKDPKKVFSNFSFLSQQPNKNYFVEYVFDPNGTVTATNMTTCKSMKYNWAFKGSSVKTAYKVYLSQANRNDIEMAIYLGGSMSYKNKIRFHTKGQYTNCYNYQNPQCNQPIAETLLVGFRDLKSNKSYVQLKDAYLVKAAELKKKKEEERLAAQKKREAENKAREDRRKKEYERAEKERREFREEAAKKRAYLNSPEGILESGYQNYMVIKGFYEARKNYTLKYVSRSQLNNAKSQIKAIEKTLVRKHRVDSKKIWSKSSEWYKKNWFSTIELYKSSGTYNQKGVGITKLYLISLNSSYNKVVRGGPSGVKKDF